MKDNNPEISNAERSLISYSDQLKNEGKSAKSGIDLESSETWLNFARGDQWAANVPKGIPPFVLNLINDIIQRKVGLLSDSRPVIQIKTSNPQLRAQAEMIEKCLRSVWDEGSWQGAELPKGVAFAIATGCNVGMMTWDPLADHGRGDLRPRFFDPRSVYIDPLITRADLLQESEYLVTEEIRSKASMFEQFGITRSLQDRVESMKPDADYSNMPDTTATNRGFVSNAILGMFRRQGRKPRVTASPIERVVCRHTWFKDWPRDPETLQPKRWVEQRTGHMVPAKRMIRHVVSAGGRVLVDQPNPYWHGHYPHEILDWGMELEHPWGQSDVKQFRRIQEALNKLASEILRNTSLNNNFKAIMDFNALDSDQMAKLSNKPMITLLKRPGSDVRFEGPPSLPAYLFQIITFLVQSMEMVSGLGEVMKGGASGVTSGLAIESLQIQAQTIIRLQARNLEGFLSRLWNKGIAGIFQYYNVDRVLSLVGPSDEIESYTFRRFAFLHGIQDPRKAFEDFGLRVNPGSSLAATKVQRAVLAGNLFRMGLLPGIEVLKSVEYSDPEGMIEQAREEQAGMEQAAAQQKGIQALTGGRGQRTSQAFPAVGGGGYSPL